MFVNAIYGILHSIQCESKKPLSFLAFFPNSWEFLVQILHVYYPFRSTLDYKFLFNIISNYDEVMPY